MKVCKKCEIEKEETDFAPYAPDKRRGVCRSCISVYDRERYKDPEERKRNVESQARYRARLREWYISLKDGKPCTDCGNTYHHAAMQWDHLPGFEKKYNVNRLVNLGSKRKILEEIAKCELVCANCHFVRTYERSHGSSK